LTNAPTNLIAASQDSLAMIRSAGIEVVSLWWVGSGLGGRFGGLKL